MMSYPCLINTLMLILHFLSSNCCLMDCPRRVARAVKVIWGAKSVLQLFAWLFYSFFPGNWSSVAHYSSCLFAFFVPLQTVKHCQLRFFFFCRRSSFSGRGLLFSPPPLFLPLIFTKNVANYHFTHYYFLFSLILLLISSVKYIIKTYFHYVLFTWKMCFYSVRGPSSMPNG